MPDDDPDIPPNQVDWDPVNAPVRWPPDVAPEVLGQAYSRGGEWVGPLHQKPLNPDPELRTQIAEAAAAFRVGLPWRYLVDQVANQLVEQGVNPSWVPTRSLRDYLAHLKTIDKAWRHNARGAGRRGRGEELTARIKGGLADGMIAAAQFGEARTHPHSAQAKKLSEQLGCDIRTLREVLKNCGCTN
jgi:hypothetical protein